MILIVAAFQLARLCGWVRDGALFLAWLLAWPLLQVSVLFDWCARRLEVFGISRGG